MTQADWTVLISAVAGGLIGSLATIVWQAWSKRHDRRLQIFRTMMEMRAAPLSPQIVNAFNAIPIEFYGVKPVIENWDRMFNHFSTEPDDIDAWNMRRRDYQADLLYAISQKLRYEFTPAQLNEIYSPRIHGNLEDLEMATRNALADVLTGRRPLPMHITNWPEDMAGPQNAPTDPS